MHKVFIETRECRVFLILTFPCKTKNKGGFPKVYSDKPIQSGIIIDQAGSFWGLKKLNILFFLVKRIFKIAENFIWNRGDFVILIIKANHRRYHFCQLRLIIFIDQAIA